jgi:membrane dipeptidase
MIRALADRGGVIGVSVAPGFLSADFHRQEKRISEKFFRSVSAGAASVEEAGRTSAAAIARIPRPPLESVVDHISWAIKVAGEDAVGLGGDLDGIDALPLGLDSVDDYPLIADLLSKAGLSQAQVEKVCYGNFARVFSESLN